MALLSSHLFDSLSSTIYTKLDELTLTLKANHPTLHHQVKEWFERASAQQFSGIDFSYEQRIESGHHRREIRQVWSVPITVIGELYQPRLWAGLKSVVMVVRVRHLWNKTTREVQFYLTSLDSDAQLLGRAIRKHWGIENQAHWTLDCTFAEDACRIRSKHSPRNLAVLRRIALNALNCEPTYKRSLRQKMKRAAMDNDYLIQIISSCFLDPILDSSDSFCQA